MITQNTWRTIGVVALTAAALMAWKGADDVTAETSRLYLLVYWGVFMVLLCIAIYMALLDLRYIRMQFKIGERELFLKTVDDEEFRANLARVLKAKEVESPEQLVTSIEDKVRRN